MPSMSPTDREFFDPHAPERKSEWEPAPDYPEGGHQYVLCEDNNSRLSRLLRVEPSVRTKDVAEHDYYEEVLLLKGGLIDLTLNEVFTAGMYAYRTPGMKHGPYDYPVGCLMFEHRYPE